MKPVALLLGAVLLAASLSGCIIIDRSGDHFAQR